MRHTNNIEHERQETTGGNVWYAIAAGAILVFAAALRFRGLDASLFEDEVWVAELVRRGGWHAHAYLTPPLFYALERLLPSASVVALRLIPAFFGVVAAAVPLFATTESRLTRIVWSALMATSSPLVFYSTKVKQYPLEATIACALIVLFLRAWRRDTLMAWIPFFALSALAVMTLYEPLFLLAACGALCFRRPRLIPAFLGIAIAFALAYRGWLSAGPESTRLHGDMTAYFGANGRWITSPRLLLAGTMHWMGQAMNLVRGWWLVVGVLVLLRRNWLFIALAALPPLFIAAASARHVYPYGEVRLMIACFPALYLLIADSLALVTRRAPLALLLLVPFALSTSRYNDTYMHVYDLRALYDYVAANHGAEAIHATPSLAAPLRFHHPEIGAFVVEWREGREAQPGWYAGPAPVGRREGVLKICDSAAWHVSAPSAAGSVPAAQSR